jgi:glutaminyl-tRNA synthetase
VLNEVKVDSCDKEVGMMLFNIAEKIKPTIYNRIEFLTKYALDKKLFNLNQLEKALEFLEDKTDSVISIEDFEKFVGVF